MKLSDENFSLFLLLSIIIFFSVLTIQDSYAQPSTIITLELSNGCKRSINCPDYKYLADAFDNSNRFISGDFILNNKTGQWERDKPYIKNHWAFYQFGTIPILIFADPEYEVYVRAKHIRIEPTLPVYIDRDRDIINNTRYEWHDRVIQECHEAVIGWVPNGPKLLADTVSYFYKNCQEPSEFKDKQTIYTPPTLFTDCHSWCKHLQFLTQAKQKAKELAEEKCETGVAKCRDGGLTP